MLPVFEIEEALLAAIGAGERVLLQAPTGSGKSTQVPQMLRKACPPEGEIVVLQPRRLATRMLARRVAHECGCKVGEEVGYQIRLEKVTSPRTRIRFVTEGVLLRQMLSDPTLKGVAALVFDEFHERHLYGDITLARALELQETVRPDLRLVVMSATLDTAMLDRAFSPCRTITTQGRTFPVETRYLPHAESNTPVWELAARVATEIAAETEGDFLIFMPGSYEIQRTLDALRQSRLGGQFALFALHGELPPEQQDAALAPSRQRKIIVSTNVAETSLTIEGVRVVIDAGLARIARYDPYRGINTLLVEKISRASSEQRAGRAGRTAPGIAYRLWTEREHLERPAQELPEVRRLDLSEVILTLKASGVEEIGSFRWIEPPDARSLERAQRLLSDLGALNATGAITGIGRRMLAYPVHPRYARMLIAAEQYGCVREAALLAALTQGRPLLRRSSGKEMDDARERYLGETHGSDLFLLMRAWDAALRDSAVGQKIGAHPGAVREVRELFEQFVRIAGPKGEGHQASEADLARCLLAGFPDQVAIRLDGGTLRCQMVHGRRGVLVRESVVRKAPLLVVAEVREVGGRDGVQTLFTQATALEEAWLEELYPEAFTRQTEVFYDKTARRVMGREEWRFHDLVLKSHLGGKVTPDAAATLLAQEVVKGTTPLDAWDHAVEQWITRLNRLAQWMPELELPPLEEGDRFALYEQLCYGAMSYREIKDRPVWPIVKAWLNPQQQQWIDQYAPERLEMPNARRFKLQYTGDGPPVIAVRIQDLYGVEEELKIAAGRVVVTIQVLAPNHRPIQITSNLRTFWRDSYPKIRQELSRRYPKHVWK